MTATSRVRAYIMPSIYISLREFAMGMMKKLYRVCELASFLFCLECEFMGGGGVVELRNVGVGDRLWLLMGALRCFELMGSLVRIVAYNLQA